MIDLRSDTVTKPTQEMRNRAATAEVGDDVYGVDPTVDELERAAADILDMDAALYVPSGTMGNQIAARVHTERGDEVIVEVGSHIRKYEVGGLATLSNLNVRTLNGGPRGIPSPEQVREAHLEEGSHQPGTGLLALENTHNSKGGIAVSSSAIAATADQARGLGVPVHLDGARLFNAAVACDVDAKEFTASVDSVMVCLSKGLGAPVGSLLVGREEFIDAARRVRQQMGGGMRQSGIIAAPGLCALRNRDHLRTDHENAERLAEGINDLEGLSTTEPETNIVLVDTSETGLTGAEFADRANEGGVGTTVFGKYIVRLVTHKDISSRAIKTALDRIEVVRDEAET